VQGNEGNTLSAEVARRSCVAAPNGPATTVLGGYVRHSRLIPQLTHAGCGSISSDHVCVLEPACQLSSRAQIDTIANATLKPSVQPANGSFIAFSSDTLHFMFEWVCRVGCAMVWLSPLLQKEQRMPERPKPSRPACLAP